MKNNNNASQNYLFIDRMLLSYYELKGIAYMCSYNMYFSKM